MKTPAIFSFFSGCGFLDLGFENAGYDVEFVNEFSPAFLKAYIYSREKMNMRKPKYGYHNTDINEYFNNRKQELKNYIREVKENGHLVGFIGGPPCPDFSVGGKNKGKDGENGKLSLTYIDLIEQEKPDFFLFENVKGLWRTTRHRQFYEELKDKLKELGYCITEKMVNSLEYGVPQDRDRIILIGIKKTLLKPKYYSDNSLLLFPWEKEQKYHCDDVKKLQWPEVDEFVEDSENIFSYNAIEELTVEHWFKKNDVYNHPNALHHFNPRSGLRKMQTIEEGDVSKKSYKRLHRWRYSPTAAYGNNEVHLHPYKARRISVSEALAIQSLPKEFQLPDNISLSNMFKTVGNGVPYLLAKAIAKTLRDYIALAVYDEN